jgi:hypothetical protein
MGKRDRKSRLQNNSQAVTPKPTEDVGKVELHKENDALRQLREHYTLGGSGDWFARDNLSLRPLRKD